jgi:hypothetical protein
MNLKSLRYYSSNISVIFLFMALVIAVLLTAFNYFYFGNLLIEKKYNNIGSLFVEGADFTEVAKDVLNVNSDIAYIKLVNSDGVLQESLGNSENVNVKETVIKDSTGRIVVIGIDIEYFNYPLLYPFGLTLLITLIIFSGFILILKLMVPQQKQSLQKLNSSLKSLKMGEYDSRLVIDSELKEDVDLIKVFDSYNELAESLEKGSIGSNVTMKSPISKQYDNSPPKLDKGNGSHTLKNQSESIKSNKVLANNDKFPFSGELPRKKVVALVSRINEYKKLYSLIDNSKLARFLTEFRKSGSAIISEYGGIVETLVNDEVVALFNISEDQDNPEMRAISAGVELLQLLAKLNKDNFHDTDIQISCKIGVYETSVPVSKNSGTPSRLGEVIEPARKICDSTPCWKLNLAEDVYNSVKQHVQVAPSQYGAEKYYSVITVEEGIINI